jgi:KDO2-lipid IV(A) lauroyltransferase
MSLAECSIAWFSSERHVERLFDVRGLVHLRAALERGRGVILYTGHFTTLEICGRALKRSTPHFAVMFSRRSNALLDEIQRRGRSRVAHEIIPRDNVRMMLRTLKRNGVVWYAPDQVYEGGALVPFFHHPAMTNLATSKLARLSGAAVVPLSFRRLEGQTRYEVSFHEALADFPTDDTIRDTRRLVEILEGFIRVAPDQYLWSHQKYKGRPPPLPDLYARASGSPALRQAETSLPHVRERRSGP